MVPGRETMIAYLLLFFLGRAASLGIYRMCWENGVTGRFFGGSAILTLLRRPLPWIAHLAFVFPTVGMLWGNFPALQGMSVMLAALLALGAIGRFGSAFFLMDRLLVFALAVGVFFSPAFVYPCLVACGCLQYTVASFRLGPGYSNLLGFEFVRASLSLIAAALALFGWLRIAGVDWEGFGGVALAAALGFQASTYVNHALAKSALGPRWWSWISENRIECLTANAWLRGWTFGRSREVAMRQVRWMARHRVAICGGAWLMEMAWLFFLADARLAAALLGATILFHLAVFSLTGLFSYQYVVNHLFVLGLILFHDTSEIFQAQHVAACVIAVPFTAWWIAWLRHGILAEGISGAKNKLADAADHLMAWWDTPLMRMYSYTVETLSGKTFALPVPKLSPHDTALTDIHTHLMILGAHPGLDPAVPQDRAFARTGVWGLTIHREDRDFLYGMMEREKTPVPAPPPAWEEMPETAAPLRGLFEGLNRMIGNKRSCAILRWPHFPGEDLAPDICPLAEPALPLFHFDQPIAAVTIRRTKTFLHRDGMILLENSVLGRVPLAETQA
jgi:hypothetical protein